MVKRDWLFASKARSHRQWVRLKSSRIKPLLYQAKARAKARGLPFDLTVEWAQRTFTGRCALTDVEFVNYPVQIRGQGPKPYSASIDRIDPKKGYVQENCRFVIFAVNAFRGTLGDQGMYDLAHILSKIDRRAIAA